MNTTIQKKNGELKQDALNAIRNSRFVNNKIYPVYYTGSGNFISKKDYTFYIVQLLKDKGYKFSQGNDAPRGGANGNFIKVSKTAFEYLKSLRV